MLKRTLVPDGSAPARRTAIAKPASRTVAAGCVAVAPAATAPKVAAAPGVFAAKSRWRKRRSSTASGTLCMRQCTFSVSEMYNASSSASTMKSG